MSIFEAIEQTVIKLFNAADLKTLPYHSSAHTFEVSDKVKKYAVELNLPAADWLWVAALFHDCGYLHTYHEHEEKSMEIAEHYLKELEIGRPEINFVNECIAATKLGVSPKQEAAALLKDTDLAYGITEKFKERGPLLRKEWELNLDKFYSDKDWEILQLNFLQTVKFDSDFGKQYFQVFVNENLTYQQAIVDKLLQNLQ